MLGAQVVLLTIPDPLDTAFFSTIQRAGPVVKLDPQLLRELWDLPADILITINGLKEMSFRLYATSIAPSSPEYEIATLPAGSSL